MKLEIRRRPVSRTPNIRYPGDGLLIVNIQAGAGPVPVRSTSYLGLSTFLKVLDTVKSTPAWCVPATPDKKSYDEGLASLPEAVQPCNRSVRRHDKIAQVK